MRTHSNNEHKVDVAPFQGSVFESLVESVHVNEMLVTGIDRPILTYLMMIMVAMVTEYSVFEGMIFYFFTKCYNCGQFS